MKLVYDSNSILRLPSNKYAGDPVEPGDRLNLSDGTLVEVTSIEKPHSPASTGRVYIREYNGGDRGPARGYYPSVVNAKWIDREDQIDLSKVGPNPDML